MTEKLLTGMLQSNKPNKQSFILQEMIGPMEVDEPSSQKKIKLPTKLHVAECMYIVNNIFERKIVNIFLPITLNICFSCSKEPSH